MDDRGETQSVEHIACSTRESDLHKDTRKKYQRRFALLIMAGLMVICVIGIAVLVTVVIKGHEIPTQSNQTCLKCQTLSTIVDRWAWKDVSEDKHTDKCCFNSETGLATTLKYYFEKRISSSLSDSDPTISWASNIKQGHLSLSNDTFSVSIMSTGLYFITTQVKSRTNVINNQHVKTTGQFYLATFREGQLSHVDDYKKRYVFSERNTEHEANLHTMTRLETGDTLIIRFPRSQKSYLASEHGAHRISMFELS